jgi:acyl carrier protein
MTNDEIRSTALRLLGNIAPEADPAQLQPNVGFREQLDIDSMDLQNFVISLYKHFGIDIPERDYAKLMTLDGCVAYLSAALAARKSS